MLFCQQEPVEMSIIDSTIIYLEDEPGGCLDGCWSCILQDYEDDAAYEGQRWMPWESQSPKRPRTYDRIKSWSARRLEGAKRRQEERRSLGDRDRSLLKPRPLERLRSFGDGDRSILKPRPLERLRSLRSFRRKKDGS